MNKKKYLIIGIVLIIILGLGTTFAWYTWSSAEEQETKIVTNLGAATVYYDAGSDIEGVKLIPTATKEEGISKTITVKANKETTYKLSFNLYLDIVSLPDGLKDASFKYELYKIGTEEAIASGNFTQESLNTNLVNCTTNSTNHIVLVSDETITTEVSTYVLYIWIDGNMDNPSAMQNKTFNFKLHADGQNAVLKETMAQHITSLYETAEKIEIQHDGENRTYNYTSSEIGLMSDEVIQIIEEMSYGETKSNTNTSVQQLSNVTTTPIELPFIETPGNIRYYGANPNNYIALDIYEEDTVVNNWEVFASLESLITDSASCKNYFDCENGLAGSEFPDSTECAARVADIVSRYGFSSVEDACADVIPAGTVKSLYRIIGVFKDIEVVLDDGSIVKQDLIKVISDKSIGYYSWDTSSSDINTGYGISDWKQADLMKLLNPGYDSNTGELCTYNEETAETVCDGTTGLVNNSLWWNGGSGYCYNGQSNVTTECDFTRTGLSDNNKDKIATVRWYLSESVLNGRYPRILYSYERNGQFWDGNVGLMYASDYGYGVDFDICPETVGSYTENCIDSNWLAHITVEELKNGLYVEDWLLSPTSSSSYFAHYINSDRNVRNTVTSSDKELYPVFYLNTDVGYVSGDGSKGNPFIVK